MKHWFFSHWWIVFVRRHQLLFRREQILCGGCQRSLRKLGSCLLWGLVKSNSMLCFAASVSANLGPHLANICWRLWLSLMQQLGLRWLTFVPQFPVDAKVWPGICIWARILWDRNIRWKWFMWDGWKNWCSTRIPWRLASLVSFFSVYMGYAVGRILNVWSESIWKHPMVKVCYKQMHCLPKLLSQWMQRLDSPPMLLLVQGFGQLVIGRIAGWSAVKIKVWSLMNSSCHLFHRNWLYGLINQWVLRRRHVGCGNFWVGNFPWRTCPIMGRIPVKLQYWRGRVDQLQWSSACLKEDSWDTMLIRHPKVFSLIAVKLTLVSMGRSFWCISKYELVISTPTSVLWNVWCRERWWLQGMEIWPHQRLRQLDS